VIDYVSSVPPRSSGKTRATKHALLNVTALVLFAASWMTRDEGLPSLMILAEQFVGVVLMSIAGYMGGTLVYRNQMAVDHRYASAGKWREVRHLRVEGAVTVGDSEDLKVDQMLLVHLDDQRIAVGRTEKGCRAFDDRCTHKGGPLSDGALICGTVQCPWHGSQFDVSTGAVKAGPATKKIATHRVAESNGQIRVG
jgi:nitrite reductase/ring-hydroxylating ferredoxin subunit